MKAHIPAFAHHAWVEFVSAHAAKGDEDAARLLGKLPTKGPRKSLDPKIREVAPKKTKAIREACVEREGGRCAIPGCPHDVLHMDHFWGRGKVPEAVENCWMLCIDHDRQKTNNRPDRLLWIKVFRQHCERHLYEGEIAKCDRAIALETAQHPEAR